MASALDGKPHHTGIEMHNDGCDVTWQAMLTRQDEYEGGGTYFRSLRKRSGSNKGKSSYTPVSCITKGLTSLTECAASWCASQMDLIPKYLMTAGRKTTTQSTRQMCSCAAELISLWEVIVLSKESSKFLNSYQVYSKAKECYIQIIRYDVALPIQCDRDPNEQSQHRLSLMNYSDK